MKSLVSHERAHAARGSNFLLLRQKKVTKEKATPVYRRFAVPCVARLVRWLRNSHSVLRQSSPKSPDQPALLGGAQGNENKNLKPVWWITNCHHTVF